MSAPVGDGGGEGARPVPPLDPSDENWVSRGTVMPVLDPVSSGASCCTAAGELSLPPGADGGLTGLAPPGILTGRLLAGLGGRGGFMIPFRRTSP